jgi:glycosyltransferase involved in cell wall biosynthesis
MVAAIMFTILHLIPTLEGGGTERQLSMLAAEQAKRGWCVNVGIRRGGVYEKSLRDSGVMVYLLGDHKGINPKLLVRISALVKHCKPDIIQTWLPQMDIVGGIVALWNSVPWIASERANGFYFQDFKFQFWVRRYLVSFASGVVANSANGAAYWREMLPAGVLVFQVANAVDVANIRNAVSVSSKASNSNDGLRDILVVGRLSPEKSFGTIIQAVYLVPEKHDIRVSIVGDGPLREVIEVSIREAGLNERISVYPFRPDWWGLLNNASALVSMSRFEGHPNVLLETMAAGCPLIVSDIPAHREFLDEKSAIMVAQDNPAMLAEAIISILSDPVSARQRAERASISVAGSTIQLTADAYEIIYEKVISGRAK